MQLPQIFIGGRKGRVKLVVAGVCLKKALAGVAA